ncbi:Recombinational DNA repair ATPase RecF [Cnuella takakiae]|uniref:Recombinational DNA repair ATPase RecF n=1 Tax=Cnuella takakiae TaxID=1302690 RepID=A0A1M5CHK0_9BACT|nr:AAA family ATPase [Cnuella takakiae]OLY91826.1 hypothetical protein BUE76_07875 [Cnuella takakiae]SHF54176.1 Recombinational DNA repair ATPase RecF [Cnuella takakiae]
MKRITSVYLENYRAFYGIYKDIKLPNGENLLIYGENGSGKSSLYKALNDYFTNSRTPVSFVNNRYAQTQFGSIKIEFNDLTSNPIIAIPNTHQTFEFTPQNSNNQVQFIQDGALVKGFLDYSKLLDVYLHKEPKPNLFNLIVLNLLFNHIPISSGGTYRLGTKWKQLQEDLIKNSYTRNDRLHQIALAELPIFEGHLTSTLDEIFTDSNRMLNEYFSDLNIQISYELAPITFNYGLGKWGWHCTTDLRLNVIKDGAVIIGDYSDILNEARLSAFAVCLYLASLKRNPQVDLQILYLDDIFIGLDAGNRLPILDIITSEFKGYQTFISTYDRHWFELAKKYFEIIGENRWVSVEFYVGKETSNGISFDKPIMTLGKTEFDRAIRYLHHRTEPDYPAAANYFRKALEHLLKKHMPKYELADTDSVQLPNYKLSQVLKRTNEFLTKTGNSVSAINIISSLLHGLIHPLSHYTINSPVYKSELTKVEAAIQQLETQFITMDIPNNYRCILGKDQKIKMSFCVDQQANHFFFYEVIIKSSLIIKNLPGSTPVVCSTKCVVDRWYGNNGGNSYPPGKAKRKDPKHNHDSLESAYKNIHSYLSGNVIAFNISANGYIANCEWLGAAGWEPLANLIIWL